MQHNSSAARVDDRDAPADQPQTLLWFEAIARKRCVLATYNGIDAKLAPHILYTRADQLYVAAVTVARRGAPVAERKLGIFKLAGLSKCRLLDEAFSVDPSYDERDPRFTETTVFGIEI